VLILSVSGVWVSPRVSFLDRHGVHVQYHVRLILLYSRDTVRYSCGTYTLLHRTTLRYVYTTMVHVPYFRTLAIKYAGGDNDPALYR
jgi:hypothetical protein